MIKEIFTGLALLSNSIYQSRKKGLISYLTRDQAFFITIVCTDSLN